MPVDKHRNDSLFVGKAKFLDDVTVPADIAGDATQLVLFDKAAATTTPVTLGVNDSGGVGFRALVIPN